MNRKNCVCFVILHYGDRRETQLCIQSILRMERQNEIEIIIVDNDARFSDEERDAFEMQYKSVPHITFLHCKEGTGFSKANNIGYQYAREQLNADFIVICNNDIEFVQADFIDRLIDSSKRMNCHVLGPYVMKRNNHEPQNPMDTRVRTREEARFTIWMNRNALRILPLIYPLLCFLEKWQENRKLAYKKRNLRYYREVHKHIVPFGACLIFTSPFIEAEELAFTPETQFYYEEYILTNRCFMKGYETGYDPSMRVVHESGSATKSGMKRGMQQMKFLMKNTSDSCAIYLSQI